MATDPETTAPSDKEEIPPMVAAAFETTPAMAEHPEQQQRPTATGPRVELTAKQLERLIQRGVRGAHSDMACSAHGLGKAGSPKQGMPAFQTSVAPGTGRKQKEREPVSSTFRHTQNAADRKGGYQVRAVSQSLIRPVLRIVPNRHNRQK